MIDLILKLLLAHIVGDFVLQPDKWVKSKRQKLHKSKYFYLHGLVHLVALLVVLKFESSYWFSIVVIVGSHLAIDWIKLKLENKLNDRILFALDQIFHLFIIGVVVFINNPYTIEIGKIYSTKSLLLVLSIVTITSVASIIMKVIMSRWILEKDISEDKESESDNSLNRAGKYIGMLERLFVFGFIVLNQWNAIGFLITAKSVFRFGDLTEAKNRKLTEYVLIGTLISFGLAIGIGLLYQYLVEQL